MKEFELEHGRIYRNTKIFEKLLKFARSHPNNDMAIFGHFQHLVDVDLRGQFCVGEDDDISVAVHLNDNEIVFHDLNEEELIEKDGKLQIMGGTFCVQRSNEVI
jgi:hypothetical protein